jgi:hypothetical protein
MGQLLVRRKNLKNNKLHENGGSETQKKFPIDGGTVRLVNILTKITKKSCRIQASEPIAGFQTCESSERKRLPGFFRYIVQTH